MDASSASPASAEAKAAFAELLARLEAGEKLDFEAEFRARAALESELRRLHSSWRRLDEAFDALSVDSSALESAADELRAQHWTAPDAPPAERALAFEELGFEQRYEVRGRVGRGGMGVVQRVYDRVLQREVAAKRLRRGSASSSRRFLAEARLAASLDHPGIVPVHDAGLDARGRPWFTMPLLAGTNLGVVLSLARDERNGWTRTRALGVLLQVCETVAYAHARGIVHRDLKPANVMVGSFGEVHVLDWGLAFLAEEGARTHAAPEETQSSRPARQHHTRDGALLGTPAYMPPEQAAGRRELVGPACDVYALGAILYHLLSGRAPYAEIGVSNDAVARAVLAGPPIALALVARTAPLELVAIAEKAMAREIGQRYAGMRELADDLRAAVEGRVVRAHESGTWAELRKWIGRNRVLSGALGVIALLCAFALGFVAWSASAQHAELLRLADARRLADLVAREEQLYPSVRARFPELERWLSEAEALAARLAVHRRDLAALRAGTGAESANEEDAWRRDALTALVRELEGIANPSTGLIARTRARLERARLVEEESLVRHRADWDAALASIAAPAGKYAGLGISAQSGLVPLGRDPESGLECFADLDSGRPPEKDAAGALVIDAQSAIVFVLVPGGSSWFGSSGAVVVPGSGESADPWARDHELPRRRVELAAYFLSKFELTQAQWSRLAGSNPSYLPLSAAADPAARGAHPLDTVSWEECARVLARAGLELPTEAQWEHAARAGSATPWWCGADAACLAGKVNAALAGSATDARESWPVSSAAPNPWGFHHILGNVAEWTRDPYVPDHAGRFRAGDAEAEAEGSRLRVVRGGSFFSPASELRCSARDEQSLGTRSAWIGLRPARALEP